MIINEIFNKNNSKLIAEKYCDWLNKGISPKDILVLTFGSASKHNIIKNIINLTPAHPIADPKIYTFNGLIYNTVSDNWSELESQIKTGQTYITPNLTGMETTQYILKQILKENNIKGYNSKKSLLHQIFRRYSLIVNNNLSDDEIKKRSELLKESFGEDGDRIIKILKAKTLSLRAFDNNRQAQIFKYIYEKTDYFKNIKYLIAEDCDEGTPLFFDFTEHLSKQLKDKLLIIDKDGGTRCGYLCAEPKSAEKLERIFKERIPDYTDIPCKIKNLKRNIFENTQEAIPDLSVCSLSKRIEMAELTVEKINDLINSGVKPNEIAVITPLQDKLLKFTLETGLKNCNPVFISGSEKLIDNPLVKSIITVLKLTFNQSVDEYELRIILTKYLHIPIKTLTPNNKFDSYSEKYDTFCELIDKLKKSGLPLSEKAYYIYSKLTDKAEKNDIIKFNFFIKELQEFEKVFANSKIENFEQEIISQIENSIIADNPYSTFEAEENDLIVSTPQKIIDNKISTKYQFWLDISSLEWIKSDIGPLYNSWVFQKSWDKPEYTIDDNILLSKEKLYKTMRKLMLNTEHIIALSSLFDTQGIENFGGAEQYLIPEKYSDIEKTDTKVFKINPREDQKQVLEYTSGTMAISAVPGAGKTTILLALIIELMKKDINPENIYVLTYMESAARNFKDRIKQAGITTNGGKLPNISTIHGLALKIIKENSNYERLGLNPDFDICDDAQRSNLLKSIGSSLKQQEFEEFDRAISTLKLSGIDTSKNNKIKYIMRLKEGSFDEMKLLRFLKFFFNYQTKLKEENLIDYDDILISAVKLLKENKDILDYYQETCRYIIEDEAQDSSSIQQELINLLSNKHKNLIRCGDINQAITTTFTNADIDGFKNFISKAAQQVNMKRSQRCSKGVWELANRIVKFGNDNSYKPFYEIYMHEVKGKNPQEETPVVSNIYNTDLTEKNEIIKEIKSIFEKNPNATIGILLRNNYQVNKWADYINNSGLCAITRNESLGQKTIFKVIFSIIKSVAKPYDNDTLFNTFKTLNDFGLLGKNTHGGETAFKQITDSGQIFISLDNDDIANTTVSRFHWDMNYWLSFPELSIDELVTMIGMHYFSKNIDKSNIYLISTLCSKLNNGKFNKTIEKLEELALKPNLSGFKFFAEEDEQDFIGGKIQIMTLHKSKGDEFDYVFIPELSEKNLTLDIEQLTLKKSVDFTEQIKRLNPNYTPKSEQELKEFLISENYRLLYVAVTRAKKRLYLSVSETETVFGKKKECIPSIIFELIDNPALIL